MTASEIQIKLIELGKKQSYLSKLFNRPPSQISNAINTKLYPTLKEKIIKHILLLESKQLKEN